MSYRRIGLSKRHHSCDHCGKRDLASTVVFSDGSRKLHLGSACAKDRSNVTVAARRDVARGIQRIGARQPPKQRPPKQTLEVDTVTGPSEWASALINGDDSGFDMMSPEDAQKERDALDRWVNKLAKDGWRVIDIATDEETGESQEPRFTWQYRLYGGTAGGGDVVDYTVHRHR